jgi:hypothetical protein
MIDFRMGDAFARLVIHEVEAGRLRGARDRLPASF